MSESDSISSVLFASCLLFADFELFSLSFLDFHSLGCLIKFASLGPAVAISLYAVEVKGGSKMSYSSAGASLYADIRVGRETSGGGDVDEDVSDGGDVAQDDEVLFSVICRTLRFNPCLQNSIRVFHVDEKSNFTL